MKKSTKNKIAGSAKVKGLKLLRIGTVVTPIAAIVYSNLDKYVTTTAAQVIPQSVSLTGGGIAAVGVAAYVTLSETKPKFSWIMMGIIFGILWALEPIISDLVMFTGIAFAGMTFNHVFIDGAIPNVVKFTDMKTQAMITDEIQEKILADKAKLELKAKQISERI